MTCLFAFLFLLNKEMEFCPFSFFQYCPCEIVLQMIPAQTKIGTIDGVFEVFSSIINAKISSLSVGKWMIHVTVGVHDASLRYEMISEKWWELDMTVNIDLVFLQDDTFENQILRTKVFSWCNV